MMNYLLQFSVFLAIALFSINTTANNRYEAPDGGYHQATIPDHSQQKEVVESYKQSMEHSRQNLHNHIADIEDIYNNDSSSYVGATVDWDPSGWNEIKHRVGHYGFQGGPRYRSCWSGWTEIDRWKERAGDYAMDSRYVTVCGK